MQRRIFYAVLNDLCADVAIALQQHARTNFYRNGFPQSLFFQSRATRKSRVTTYTLVSRTSSRFGDLSKLSEGDTGLMPKGRLTYGRQP